MTVLPVFTEPFKALYPLHLVDDSVDHLDAFFVVDLFNRVWFLLFDRIQNELKIRKCIRYHNYLKNKGIREAEIIAGCGFYYNDIRKGITASIFLQFESGNIRQVHRFDVWDFKDDGSYDILEKPVNVLQTNAYKLIGIYCVPNALYTDDTSETGIDTFLTYTYRRPNQMLVLEGLPFNKIHSSSGDFPNNYYELDELHPELLYAFPKDVQDYNFQFSRGVLVFRTND